MFVRMTPNAAAFDQWIRGRFVELNTSLEEIYFARPDRADVSGVGTEQKAALVEEGRNYIARLLEEGNTNEGFDSGFDLLGNVGLYMAACGRHEITQHDRDKRSPLREASALAMQLGASLGVVPRFATSHLTTHNRAVAGTYKSFTSLRDEFIFTDYNTRGILAYKRAGEALLRILPLGCSHPVTADLLIAARGALNDVTVYNDRLNNALDVDRFFYCVRPYFKPHHVGLNVYRGANAGDFAGINIIDMLLGLCSAEDPFYSQLLVDKFLYMMPDDQILLRDCIRRRSLLAEFIDLIEAGHIDNPEFQQNLRLFLEVCELHGKGAAQHHDQLVRRFIEIPAAHLQDKQQKNITASGPPLPVLLKSLEKLRDLRLAAPRDDMLTSHNEIARLKAALK